MTAAQATQRPRLLQAMTDAFRQEDVRRNTARMSAVFEDMVRRYPEQWLWIHKRWKTRPLGEPKLY